MTASPITRLDKLHILPALPNDCHLEIFSEITSTSEYAKEHPELSTPRIILAEQQTAGVGRLGRPWISPFGVNIYYTLMWDYYGSKSPLSTLSLRVALSLVKALKDSGIRGIQLKWPNDLLYQDAKLGGVLILNQAGPHGSTRLCISFGLNVNAMPETDVMDIGRASTGLQEITGKFYDRNPLIVAITQQLFRDLAEFTLQENQDWMQEWKSLDALFGKKVQLNHFSKDIEGIARGINEQGQLIIEDNLGNQQYYSAGDVTLSASFPTDNRC